MVEAVPVAASLFDAVDASTVEEELTAAASAFRDLYMPASLQW